MKFRPQRGSLKDSLKDIVTLEPTYDALAKHLHTSPEAIEVYYYTYDSRLYWDTHIVTVDGVGVGFIDHPIQR